MADVLASPGRLTLHGLADVEDPSKQPSQAIVLKLSSSLLQDVRKAAATPAGVQFVTGATPRLRLGKRTIDLNLSPEAFEHELYSASRDVLSDLHLTSIVSHRAEIKAPVRKQSLGPDAALAALKSSLASYEQEKQAKSTNITGAVLPVRENRFDAAREEKKARRRGLLAQNGAALSHASGTISVGSIPKSVPASDAAARQRAMRVPIIHLLAIRPHTRQEIQEKTHIPREDLEETLAKIGQEEQGKWQLVHRAYKDLDVWNFGYPTQDERQAAIDNSIRAYDRQRIEKDDKLWQQLLPKEDRGKGIVLSKLHLSGAASANRGITLNQGGSPLSHFDGSGDGGRDQSAANTPRLVAAKVEPASGLIQRLFAKDPKRARAAEEKKRKIKDTAVTVSDKDVAKPPRKKQATKANNPKVKSAEIVQDSSDESGEEGEVKESVSARGLQNKPSNAVSSVSTTTALKTGAQKSIASDARGSVGATSTPAGKLPKPRTSLPGSGKMTASATKSNNTAASKLSKSAATGVSGTGGNLPAPSSSQSRNHPSPPKNDSKPLVPSPLGAARPRLMSDVSDRAAVGVQRVRNGTDLASKTVTNGSNTVRKRNDTVTSTESRAPTSPEAKVKDRRSLAPTVARKTVPVSSNTATPSRSDAIGTAADSKPASTLKRKHLDVAPLSEDAPATATKVRRISSLHRDATSTSKQTDHPTSQKAASQRPSSTASARISTTTTTNSTISTSTNARRPAAPPPNTIPHSTSSRSSTSSSNPGHDHHGGSSRSSRSNSSSSSSLPLAAATAASNHTRSHSDTHHHHHSPSSPTTSSSASTSSRIVQALSYAQGVTLARRFRDEYYPRYATMYDEQAACEARGEKVPPEERQRLWNMHERLETMKKEIRAASLRGE